MAPGAPRAQDLQAAHPLMEDGSMAPMSEISLRNQIMERERAAELEAQRAERAALEAQAKAERAAEQARKQAEAAQRQAQRQQVGGGGNERPRCASAGACSSV